MEEKYLLKDRKYPSPAYLNCKYVGTTLLSDGFLLLFKDYRGEYFDGVFRRDHVSAGGDELSKLLKIIANRENSDGTIDAILPYYTESGELVPYPQKVRRENIIYEEELNLDKSEKL
ncbi:hypothetical protein HY449_02220 [Candidatus Pacearchaeota archaeon]|nr:hypothetical protein [Candidatus Pacearchaeota archaeon]